jgi:hypothetical protein
MQMLEKREVLRVTGANRYMNKNSIYSVNVIAEE